MVNIISFESTIIQFLVLTILIELYFLNLNLCPRHTIWHNILGLSMPHLPGILYGQKDFLQLISIFCYGM